MERILGNFFVIIFNNLSRIFKRISFYTIYF